METEAEVKYISHINESENFINDFLMELNHFYSASF